jgi:hypothetical protein
VYCSFANSNQVVYSGYWYARYFRVIFYVGASQYLPQSIEARMIFIIASICATGDLQSVGRDHDHSGIYDAMRIAQSAVPKNLLSHDWYSQNCTEDSTSTAGSPSTNRSTRRFSLAIPVAGLAAMRPSSVCAIARRRGCISAAMTLSPEFQSS